MQVLFILVGAFLGAVAHEDTGFIVGAAVGYLLVRSWRQQRAIDELRDALAARSAQPRDPAMPAEPVGTPQPGGMDAAAAAVPASPPPPLPSSATPPPAAAVRRPAQGLFIDPPDDETVATAGGASSEAAGRPAAVGELPDAVRPRAPATAADPPGPAAPGWLATLRTWFFGGNTIVKAGVGILFIGLAFLAKYASEHVSLPVELRLAGIAAVALVLLGLGWRLRQHRAGYAQVLQGGAIAALYLTLFAAFRFYGVLGAAAAFALMAGVAALAAALAVLQNAPALASVGALGGYATPLLLSSGSGSHVALFSYYLVLSVGIAGVSWFRTWRALNLIGFFFSFGVATAWGVLSYRADQYASSQAFLVAFWAVFVAVLLLPARRLSTGGGSETGAPAAPGASGRWVNGSLLFGLPTVAFGLQYGLVRDMAWGPALSALAAAAFYVGLAVWLRRRVRRDPAAAELSLAFEGCLAVGAVFVTLVIPFALDARAVSGAWALEGAGLVWLGWRQQRRLARAAGYALLLVAGGLLLHAAERHAWPSHWFNATAMSGLMLVAGALLAAHAVWRHAPQAAGGAVGATEPAGEWIAEGLLIVWAVLAAALLSSLQVHALVEPPSRLSALLTGATGWAAVFTAVAWRWQWPAVALPAAGLVLAMLLAGLIGLGVQDHPFAHGGWWAWPLAVAAQAWVLHRAAPLWPQRLSSAVHAGGLLALALLGAATGRWLLRASGDPGSAWPWLGWLAVPALLLLALPRPALAARWPLRLNPSAYQHLGAWVLALGLIVWVVVANIESPGSAQPLPYLPLINPLDLGVAVALFAVWRHFAAEGGGPMPGGASARSLLLPVLGACAFLWLNAMLVRGFHHLGDVPFQWSSWTRSMPVQTGLALLWTVTAMALMWTAARRAQRAPWMVGAALLAVVVLKLLLVDLSGSGTVTRIVSFIGVGVLMLVIGYVAPLPAAAARPGLPAGTGPRESDDAKP